MLLNNFRLIGLLRAYSKILEKAVHKRMLSFRTLNHALSNYRFDFHPNYSTFADCNCLITKQQIIFEK